MTFIEKVWFPSHPMFRLFKWLLLPLMIIFWLLSALRRMAYKNGLFRSKKIDVPVIIVGNISVGGNGKTPLVVYLAQWLKEQGFKPGILSRGYGGNASFYPATVEAVSDVSKVGDEPVLIKQRVSCPVVVDPKRPRGAKYLVDKHGCDLVLCDDGLQHYALERDIEIVVVDGARRHGNRWLLPMGPLRETEQRLTAVNFVINNGGPIRDNEILMEIVADDLVNVHDTQARMPLTALQQPVTAVAAIGNPQRFFDLLQDNKVQLKEQIAFIDHYQFEENDIPDDIVLMTEKDSVKCRHIAKQDWWFLPIRAELPETFLVDLKNKLDLIKKR
ncbi:MAG: tetraacyldisaccharide 4'-kinase [Aliiglaciecola sp.]